MTLQQVSIKKAKYAAEGADLLKISVEDCCHYAADS